MTILSSGKTENRPLSYTLNTFQYAQSICCAVLIPNISRTLSSYFITETDCNRIIYSCCITGTGCNRIISGFSFTGTNCNRYGTCSILRGTLHSLL